MDKKKKEEEELVEIRTDNYRTIAYTTDISGGGEVI